MSAARGAIDFHRGEAARVEAELQTVSADLARYGRENSLTDPSAEKQVILSLIATLEPPGPSLRVSAKGEIL